MSAYSFIGDFYELSKLQSICDVCENGRITKSKIMISSKYPENCLRLRKFRRMAIYENHCWFTICEISSNSCLLGFTECLRNIGINDISDNARMPNSETVNHSILNFMILYQMWMDLRISDDWRIASFLSKLARIGLISHRLIDTSNRKHNINNYVLRMEVYV